MLYIVKSNLYFALILSVIILMANSSSVAFIIHSETISNYESHDHSKGHQHSHHNFFEDDMLNCKELVRTHEADILAHSLLFLNPDFKNILISRIWQPPKIS